MSSDTLSIARIASLLGWLGYPVSAATLALAGSSYGPSDQITLLVGVVSVGLAAWIPLVLHHLSRREQRDREITAARSAILVLKPLLAEMAERTRLVASAYEYDSGWIFFENSRGVTNSCGLDGLLHQLQLDSAVPRVGELSVAAKPVQKALQLFIDARQLQESLKYESPPKTHEAFRELQSGCVLATQAIEQAIEAMNRMWKLAP